MQECTKEERYKKEIAIEVAKKVNKTRDLKTKDQNELHIK